MKHRWIAVVAVAAALVGVAGCSRNPVSQAVKSKAFESAPAAVKDSWKTAIACAETNNHAGAAPVLFRLRQESLTPEQSAAVGAVLKTVTEALYQAADRGDPAAQQAIADLKKRPRH